MSDEEHTFNEKEVAFYSATTNAWYTTRFEKDRHLLTLSSAGIGLLVTLATAFGVVDACLAVVYVGGLLSFLVCILTVLVILDLNADYLRDLIKSGEGNETRLKALDRTATISFVLGVVFTLLVGVLSGAASL